MFVAVPAASNPDVLAAAAPGRTMRRVRRGLPPYLYLLPAVAMLVTWTYAPLVETFQISFYHWNLIPTQPMVPVGWQNYLDVVALPELHQAIAVTLVSMAAFLVISVALPVGIALASRRVEGRAKTVYQALIFLPYLVTPVATSAIWRWMFDPTGGTVTVLARWFGADLGNIFRNPDAANWAIIAAVGWQLLGFGVLVVSAGIAGINPDYAAAASLDGASPWAIVRRITLPLLSPTLAFLVLMTVLLSAQWAYPVIDILTQGGPSGSTTNIYYLLYEFGFRNFDAGSSAAAGIMFFVVFGVVALVFVELSERLSFYDN